MPPKPQPPKGLHKGSIPKDPRKQIFADAVLAGDTLADAYIKAGFKPKNRKVAESAATRLRHRAEVQEYIESVQASAADASVLTLMEKRRFLARIVRTPITNLHPDEEKDADLIKSFATTTGELSSSMRLEKLDPLKAIEIDNKLSGNDPEANALKELAAAIGALGATTSPLPSGTL